METNTTTSTPARRRGRPARATTPDPVAATADQSLRARSAIYASETPVWADGADAAHMRVRWRGDLDLTADQIAARTAETTAYIAELDASVADITKREAQAAARVAEYEAAAAADVDALKTEVAAGRCSLDDLAVAKARADMAGELLPVSRTAHRNLAAELRDMQGAARDARRELRDLEAVDTWQALQDALVPAHAAIAAWFQLTGDAAIYIGAPRDEN